MAKRGRPSKYSEDVAIEICELLAQGQTLTEICSREGMPPISTVIGWVNDGHVPGFSERYARARAIQIEVLAEEIRLIADDGSNDYVLRKRGDNEEMELQHEHVTRSRLRIDTRKWLLSKLKPEKYADNLKIDSTAKVTTETSDAQSLASALTPDELATIRARLAQSTDKPSDD